MQDAQKDARQKANQRPTYIGDSNAELLALEWEGYESGYAAATSAGSTSASADQIVEASGNACAQTLTGYVFLNREAFHQAFTHGWIAGYLAAQHGWSAPTSSPTQEGGSRAL